MKNETINPSYDERIVFRINDSTRKLLVEKARQERVNMSVIARRILEDGLGEYKSKYDNVNK